MDRDYQRRERKGENHTHNGVASFHARLLLLIKSARDYDVAGTEASMIQTA
jgi:hypothetical protein